jgi:hypothetical protein
MKIWTIQSITHQELVFLQVINFYIIKAWRNPFNRSLADSGGIIIGAGAPPPGTHGGYYLYNLI